MSGLIIEGICAAGKSMIFKGLSQCKSYNEKQSKLQLSEYLTERIIENIKPSVGDRVNLLSGYVDMFNRIHTNFYDSRFKDTQSWRIKPCYLVERFHLTHAVEADDFNAFKEIDTRLNQMDFKLLILAMDDEVIRERIEDTFPRRPETWRKYVMSFGGIEGACIRYSDMQSKLLKYAKETALPIKIMNTTDKNWDAYIKQAEEFWGII